jgi:hypothetical protein
MLIGAADKIFVNSKFTAEVFCRTFRRIRQIPTVLYPAIDASSLMNSNNMYNRFHITCTHSLTSLRIVN